MSGFCVACKRDVESATTRYPSCPDCAAPLTPASWGRRTQRWVDGAWSPAIPRPEGYRYAPKVHLTPSTAIDAVTLHCDRCGSAFAWVPRGGSTARYCTPLCKTRAGQTRRRRESAA